MLTIKSGFIGRYSPPNADSLSLFQGRDSESLFNENLKKLGPSWYYANNKITYKFNSLGHRSMEFDDLNLDNYALCVGCSNTEGTALEVETRYSNLLQKDLNIDVYNMGIGGTGHDVVAHNLLTWAHTVKKKPKFIVIQWSDLRRFLTEIGPDSYMSVGLWNEGEPTKFILAGDSIRYFKTKSLLARKLIKQAFDVPIIEILWNEELFFKPSDNDICIPKAKVENDFGRDLSHPGIKTHRIWADSIIEKLKNLPS